MLLHRYSVVLHVAKTKYLQMFPKKNRHIPTSDDNRDEPESSRSSYRNGPESSRNNYGRRNDNRNSWRSSNDYRRDDRYNRGHDRRRRTPPRSSSNGYGFERRDTYGEKCERSANDAALERAEAAERELKKLKQQMELHEEAQGQRFGAFGTSDSSDDGGGAPINIKKNKKDKKKRKRRSSSSSSSGSSDRRKRKHRKYSDSEIENKYEFLKSLRITVPPVYTHVVPEKIKPVKPVYEKRRKQRNRRINLDVSKLKIEPVECIFPPKEPTEKSDGIFRLEEVPYNIRNSASVADQQEVNWETIPYEEFIALDILQQNTFAQSSATKKVKVYKYRLAKATTTKEKINCYIKLIELEEARVDELRKSEKITGKFNTNETKLALIYGGIKECGENVDLRLLEIDVLTTSKGENSEEVKKAWDNLMNRFPNDLKMWRRRLTYYRNKRSIFTAGSYIKNSILPCLNKLGGILNQTFKSHPKQEGTEEFITDVIVTAATFYVEMGSTYKAIGILQALIEFYFLAPKNVKDNCDFKKKLEAFEHFWRTEIPKVGDKDAIGWYKVTTNASFTKYDFPQNPLLKKEKETKVFKELIGKVFNLNITYCRDDKMSSSCERWSKIEQSRTEFFWEPFYNSESNPNILDHYNSFSDIKPYILQLPMEIIEKAVFKILTKLGAVFPDVKDYSQESIFERCNVTLVDDRFKLKYEGMMEFIDNILKLISGTNEKMYLYATVARLMTCKAFALNNTKGEIPSREKFLEGVAKIFQSLLRSPNVHEHLIVTSYAKQLLVEISQHFSHFDSVSDPETSNKILSSIGNIFDADIEVPKLLASVRYNVMVCRGLPHYSDQNEDQNLLTKLKYLMKVSFPSEDINFESKFEQERAIKKWETVKFHENYFNLPSGSRWIGDINALALELFSTLCYEIENNPAKKFEAFDKLYSKIILERNEDLTEVYFKTWHRHLERYHQEKTLFMESLESYIRCFPKNDVLTMLFISILRHDPFETRFFFLHNQHEDDIVKVVRCIIQIEFC
uniref:Uncharacterized protein n=1 Tax=Panagrolaimus superbus TaxID=310955 RepID=A0A914ZBT1_9BILA